MQQESQQIMAGGPIHNMAIAKSVSRDEMLEKPGCTSLSHQNKRDTEPSNNSDTANSSPSNDVKSEATSNTQASSPFSPKEHLQQQQVLPLYVITREGAWQSKQGDSLCRRRMIGKIVNLMQRASKKESPKMTQYAIKLEVVLYQSAESKQEYMNLSTLKQRLKMIAHGLGMLRSHSLPAAQA